MGEYSLKLQKEDSFYVWEFEGTCPQRLRPSNKFRVTFGKFLDKL